MAGNVLTEIQHRFPGGRNDLSGREILMLHYRNIIGCAGNHVMLRDLRFSSVRRKRTAVHDLAVLVVGKADRAVIAPLPCAICHYGLPASVCMGNFQLSQQLRLPAVLIFQPPCTAGTAVPSVRQLHGQLIFARNQQISHVDGLILDSLAVVCQTGSHDEGTGFPSVDFRLVNTAGSDIESGFLHILRIKSLAEAVHRIPFQRIDRIISGNPLGLPLLYPRFKGGLRPLSAKIVFVPKAHLPEHSCLWRNRFAAPFAPHCAAFYFTATPKIISLIVFSNDLVCALANSTLAVPEQTWNRDINANGIFQIFRPQSDGVHVIPPCAL